MTLFNITGLLVADYGSAAFVRRVGTGIATRRPPSSAVFNVGWSDYFTQLQNPINYGVNLNADAGSAPLDMIKSAYVDNSQNVLPVTLYFGDTGYSISIPAAQQTWVPVFTNQLKCTAYIKGMSTVYNALKVLQTKIILLNVDANPFAANSTGLILANSFFISGTTGALTNLLVPFVASILPSPGPGFMLVDALQIRQRRYNGVVTGEAQFGFTSGANMGVPAGPNVSAVAFNILDLQNLNLRVDASIPFSYQIDNLSGAAWGPVTWDTLAIYNYPVP